MGNRTDLSWAEYNGADELTLTQNHQYDYYDTGSLHHEYDSYSQTVQQTYTYTAANLLESATHNVIQGEPVSSMIWDADGNRVRFVSSTGAAWQTG